MRVGRTTAFRKLVLGSWRGFLEAVAVSSVNSDSKRLRGFVGLFSGNVRSIKVFHVELGKSSLVGNIGAIDC